MDSLEKIVQQYQDRIEKREKEIRQIRSKSRRYSFVRFLVFIGIALSIYYAAVSQNSGMWWVLAVVLVILFFFLINRHVAIKYQHSLVEKSLEINRNEIDVLHQKPSMFPDGNEFHQDYTYTSDLDVFGPRSLYHMMQRCFSQPGRKTLADWLLHPQFDATLIQNRQHAVGSVMDKIDLRQEFIAHGLVNFSGTEQRFDPKARLMEASTARNISVLRWFIPLISIISIAGAITLANNNILLYGFLLNLVITGLYYKTTNSVMMRAEQNLKTLRNYNPSLKLIVGHEFEDELLKKKNKALMEAHRQFNILQKRYDLLESRSNPIMGLLLNGTIGFDFQVLSRLNQWYENQSPQIPVWEEDIGWFEALFSLATFAWNNPSYTFPHLDRDFGIRGSQIRHPFIPDHENVGNPLDLTKPLKVILLTGSNMSGKSTFLRSVGINQVLALAGSVVAADQFHTGLYGILTSFRKADSIQEHTSLFYDELKKLQFIFKTLEAAAHPQLILLDEILRGTNSDDKYYGSKQVLLRLKDQNAMAILATHDIDLARLEDEHGPVIQNYSFESQIKDGELHFEYRLHRGVAVNKNATFLMKKMGIIEIDK